MGTIRSQSQRQTGLKLHSVPKARRSESAVVKKWSEECQQSFEALKAKLPTAPVLAYADFSRPFILVAWGRCCPKSRTEECDR